MQEEVVERHRIDLAIDERRERRVPRACDAGCSDDDERGNSDRERAQPVGLSSRFEPPVSANREWRADGSNQTAV
jgi:hypothetical protein